MNPLLNGKPFWIVVGAGTGERIAHVARGEADNEAARLARENPDKEFVVLKAMAGFKVQASPPPVTKVAYGDAE